MSFPSIADFSASSSELKRPDATTSFPLKPIIVLDASSSQTKINLDTTTLVAIKRILSHKTFHRVTQSSQRLKKNP